MKPVAELTSFAALEDFCRLDGELFGVNKFKVVPYALEVDLLLVLRGTASNRYLGTLGLLSLGLLVLSVCSNIV